MGNLVSESSFDKYPKISKVTKETLLRYVNQRISTGDFLKAVLSNDLMNATFKADLSNEKSMVDICKWIYFEAPSMCWGSRERVENWLKNKM
jgi:hypothetical protein